MFSPDRQGFFPALWVQFVQELGEGERREFAALTERFLTIFSSKWQIQIQIQWQMQKLRDRKGGENGFCPAHRKVAKRFLQRYDDNDKGKDNDVKKELVALTRKVFSSKWQWKSTNLPWNKMFYQHFMELIKSISISFLILQLKITLMMMGV